jgi:hypothetical protein
MPLVNYNNKIIAAGGFTITGGSNIAAWDGTSWTSLGTGLNDTVYALAVYTIIS